MSKRILSTRLPRNEFVLQLTSNLSREGRVNLVLEFLKFLMYQRQQLPLPLPELEREYIRSHQTAQEQYSKDNQAERHPYSRDLAVQQQYSSVQQVSGGSLQESSRQEHAMFINGVECKLNTAQLIHSKLSALKTRQMILKQERLFKKYKSKLDKFMLSYRKVSQAVRNVFASRKCHRSKMCECQDVLAVRFAFGPSHQTARELYTLKLPAASEDDASCRDAALLRDLFRSFVTNEKLGKIASSCIGLKRLWILVQRSRCIDSTVFNRNYADERDSFSPDFHFNGAGGEIYEQTTGPGDCYWLPKASYNVLASTTHINIQIASPMVEVDDFFLRNCEQAVHCDKPVKTFNPSCALSSVVNSHNSSPACESSHVFSSSQSENTSALPSLTTVANRPSAKIDATDCGRQSDCHTATRTDYAVVSMVETPVNSFRNPQVVSSVGLNEQFLCMCDLKICSDTTGETCRHSSLLSTSKKLIPLPMEETPIKETTISCFKTPFTPRGEHITPQNKYLLSNGETNYTYTKCFPVSVDETPIAAGDECCLYTVKNDSNFISEDKLTRESKLSGFSTLRTNERMQKERALISRPETKLPCKRRKLSFLNNTESTISRQDCCEDAFLGSDRVPVALGNGITNIADDSKEYDDFSYQISDNLRESFSKIWYQLSVPLIGFKEKPIVKSF